ncbi:MAG: hypothetical protein BGP06_15760 [Rhizobiales bacterium 65-9]|nr:MAG: hypothetical protein BGP06_15760 [Rhizobiales bacterium 65-9]
MSNGPFGPVELTAGVVGTNLLNQTVRDSVSFRKDEVVARARRAGLSQPEILISRAIGEKRDRGRATELQ